LLKSVEKEILAKLSIIEQLKKEIAGERAKLAEKQAKLEKRRSENVKAIAKTGMYILLLALIAVVVLYFVGRAAVNRRKK
jgi:anaerobic C4-dicarboxylate transporter